VLKIAIFIALFRIKPFLFRSTGLKELRLLIIPLVLFAGSFQSKHLRVSCAQATEVDLGDHKPVFSNKCTTINFDFFYRLRNKTNLRNLLKRYITL